MPTTPCSTPAASRVRENKYYYPGFTIGGPVLIPGTNFNKNRNKLFFFTGFEYFYQVSGHRPAARHGSHAR